jgi:glycine C-acetyltransferase
MYTSFRQHVSQQLDDIRGAGTYKNERVIMTPQGTTLRVADGKPVLNLCANNYLGLAQHPAIAAAAACKNFFMTIASDS